MPSTWPDGATLRANAIVVAPLPQPTSMTRSPGFRLRPIDHEVGDRPEHDVLRRLPIGPALAGRPVPVGDLVGVLIVALGGVHVRKLSVASVRLRSSSFGETAFALTHSAGLPSRSAQREGW